LDCFDVVDVTRPGLNVIKDVIFAQTAIADDLDVFNKSLLLRLRLGYDASGSREADKSY